MSSPLSQNVKLYPVDSAQYLLMQGPDMISAQLRDGKVWETPTLEIAQLFLAKVDHPVVVDIGANLGAFAVPTGLFVKQKGGQLHAFEPQRQVYYQLCGNLFSNGLARHCHAHHLAVGDHHGSIEVPVLDLETERNVGSLSLDAAIRSQQRTLSTPITATESVTMTTLDALALPHADLIKIDVEGLELEVLKGGRKWLADAGYPPILYEVWGDYMKDQIGKRNRLMNLVQKGFGYETAMLGELCIAQHPSRKVLDFSRTPENHLAIRSLV